LPGRSLADPSSLLSEAAGEHAPVPASRNRFGFAPDFGYFLRVRAGSICIARVAGRMLAIVATDSITTAVPTNDNASVRSMPKLRLKHARHTGRRYKAGDDTNGGNENGLADPSTRTSRKSRSPPVSEPGAAKEPVS
jgi:hypothetical protein